MTDRYVKTLLTVIAVALVFLAAGTWLPTALHLLRAAPAEAQPELSIPGAWGRLISFSDMHLLLEAPDHTMRIVKVDGNVLKVRAVIRWQ